MSSLFCDRPTLKPHEWTFKLQNGLSGPLRLRAKGVGAFKVRSLRGLSCQKFNALRQDFALFVESKNRALIINIDSD